MVTVFLVEDSPLYCSQLTQALRKTGEIEVAGTTDDPFWAWEQIVRQPVDVLLLDITLSRFNSYRFLHYLLDSCPIPTILLAPVTAIGSQEIIDALQYGAVAVWVKKGWEENRPGDVEELAHQILLAASIERSRLNDLDERRWGPVVPEPDAAPPPPSVAGAALAGRKPSRLVAVGASTGGVAAMLKLFGALPVNCPPTLAVLHLPVGFTNTFCQQLAGECVVKVKIAEDGELPREGHVYLAPGNRHLVVEKHHDGCCRLRVIGGPRVFFQRPAIDVLFHSLADNIGPKAIGVLLTGMGKDGAAGLLRMREAGAHTITQDEASSMVYGMPREAVQIGASCQSLSLERIAPEILRHGA